MVITGCAHNDWCATGLSVEGDDESSLFAAESSVHGSKADFGIDGLEDIFAMAWGIHPGLNDSLGRVEATGEVFAGFDIGIFGSSYPFPRTRAVWGVVIPVLLGKHILGLHLGGMGQFFVVGKGGFLILLAHGVGKG